MHLVGCHNMTVQSMLAEHKKSEWLQLRSTTSLVCPVNTRTGLARNTCVYGGICRKMVEQPIGVNCASGGVRFSHAEKWDRGRTTTFKVQNNNRAQI